MSAKWGLTKKFQGQRKNLCTYEQAKSKTAGTTDYRWLLNCSTHKKRKKMDCRLGKQPTYVWQEGHQGQYSNENASNLGTSFYTHPPLPGLQLEKALTEWQKNSQPCENIQEAKVRIKEAFDKLNTSNPDGKIELNLDDLNLVTLPNDLSFLQGIHTLKLNGNYFAEIPYSIDQLKPDLRHLEITSCQIILFPKWLIEHNLCILKITNTNINSLPEFIGEKQSKLKNLYSLIFYSNEIKELPNSIANFKNLKVLDIAYNNIENFPLAVLSLRKLESLDLSGNYICHLPKDMRKLNKLNELNLGNNNFKSLPTSLGDLINLRVLNIKDNENLQEVPLEIHPDCVIKLSDYPVLRANTENAIKILQEKYGKEVAQVPTLEYKGPITEEEYITEEE